MTTREEMLDNESIAYMQNTTSEKQNTKQSEATTRIMSHHSNLHHNHRTNKAYCSESNQREEIACLEHATVQNYQPPAVSQSTLIGQNTTNIQNNNPPPPSKAISYVYNPSDGSVLLDHHGRPISVDKLLATKPLRNELSTRPGPGNKKLTYISGDGISRTLNDIFGFDGWNLDITRVERIETIQNNKDGKYTVVYAAQVKLTHKASGAYKEDCGAGDATDRSFATAVGHALKQSITDAMKRAAPLYSGNFSVKNAPTSLKSALDKYDIERAHSKFGFAKDQTYNNNNHSHNAQNVPPTSTTMKMANPISSYPSSSHDSSTTSTTSARVPFVATTNPSSTSNINENATASAKTASSTTSQQPPTLQQKQNTAPVHSSASLKPTISNKPASISGPSCSSSTLQQQQQPRVSNTMQHGPPIVPQHQSNNYVNRIAPPPTPTDALRNSMLFSQQQQQQQERPPTSMLSSAGILMSSSDTRRSPTTPYPPRISLDYATTTTTTSSSSANKSRSSRLSIGQTPIQQVPLVTPINNDNSSTDAIIMGRKRLMDSSSSSSLLPNNSLEATSANKRPRNINNPYMSTS
eukprot:scaffold2447_cov110-Cylindrotheca_fusiformis.AAC.8